MRTSNAKVKQVIISAYLVLIVTSIVVATIFSGFTGLTPSPLLTFVVVILVFVIIFFALHSVAKYFEYDSDGMKVVVTNRGLLLSDTFNYREKIVEFEKDKLRSYKFNNYYFYKSLVLFIEGRHGNLKRERFNVTLVHRKKRKYIRQSLRKMIKENRKNSIDS